ncbi:MAG: hypothetical protein LW636_10305 [Planctomycetaceae bacterium]|jgi:hypothetical protein|nr:hypothetical protein [Planctomycetaceae bacterium]
MKPSAKFSPYSRKSFLATVPAEQRALAERLCALLEAAFATKDIAVYSGFPIVVRDMEWIAGFAMRKSGPVAYCCSPATLAEMGAELKPYMSGKSCIAVKPRKGESIDAVLALVARAFKVASRHGGMISKADRRARERARAADSKSPAPKPRRPSRASRSTRHGEAAASVPVSKPQKRARRGRSA